jgi:hypothetical protein
MLVLGQSLIPRRYKPGIECIGVREFNQNSVGQADLAGLEKQGRRKSGCREQTPQA